MNSSKPAPREDSVTVEIEIAAPPRRVFNALIDARQLAAWWGAEPSTELLKFEMDGRKGGKYLYECAAKPGADMGPVGETLKRNHATHFVCRGEVLECDPPHLLVWSWIANWHEHPEQATTVRWELTPTAAGTRVRVIHSGLSSEPLARKDYGQGWQGVLHLFENYLASNTNGIAAP